MSAVSAQVTSPTGSGNPDLLRIIKSEIARTGPIPFARFMDLALYEPHYGYYMTGRLSGDAGDGQVAPRIGWAGDFYTAPDVHGLLAKALVRQVVEVDELLGHPSPLTVVEMGAGKGLLAHDFMQELEAHNSGLSSRLTYVLIERSPFMRRLQTDNLCSFRDRGWSIHWVSALGEFGEEGLTGVVFSNEFVDALPVHRVTTREGMLKEIFVNGHAEGLYEEVSDPSTAELQAYLEEFGVRLPEGHRTEVHVNALHWIGEVARILRKGLVLTIDYGHVARDYYRADRTDGTLLGYHRHRAVKNPYILVGEQDLTAHVNFSALVHGGRRNGLAVAGLTNLMSYLVSMGAEEWLAYMEPESEELRAAIDLLRPQGMGGTFKVLLQQKGLQEHAFRGLHYSPFFEGIF